MLGDLSSEEELKRAEALFHIRSGINPSTKTKSQQVLDRVTPLLKADSATVRCLAIQCVRAWQSDGTFNWKLAIPLLSDDHPRTRWTAIQVLAKHPAPEVANALLGLSNDEFPIFCPILKDELSEFAADAAVQYLSSKDEVKQIIAIRAIGELGRKEHIPLLQPFTKSENKQLSTLVRNAVESINNR